MSRDDTLIDEFRLDSGVSLARPVPESEAQTSPRITRSERSETSVTRKRGGALLAVVAAASMGVGANLAVALGDDGTSTRRAVDASQQMDLVPGAEALAPVAAQPASATEPPADVAHGAEPSEAEPIEAEPSPRGVGAGEPAPTDERAAAATATASRSERTRGASSRALGGASRGERGEGQLNLMAVPAARVYLRGRLLGETPLMGHTLPAGTHRLELRPVSGGEARQVRVVIRPGELTREAVR